MRIWNLNDPDCDSGVDIRVFIPGPPGPPIVDVGSFLVPTVCSGELAAPIYRRQRSFISASAPVGSLTIGSPDDNGPWELYVYVVGENSLTLNDLSNVKLSGQWIGQADSVLYLQWDGNSRYVEGGRNEI